MLQFRFWTIWSQKKILVSEKFGIRKSLGFGKKLVSEKSLEVGFSFGNLVLEKSLGTGFGQNFGIVTHCSGFNCEALEIVDYISV